MKKVDLQIEKDEKPSTLHGQILESLPSKSKTNSRFFKSFLIIAMLLLFTLAGTSPSADTVTNQITSEELTLNLSDSLQYVHDVRKKAHDALIKEVENYISKITPDTKIKPEYLVSKCLEYDIDVVFVLAQGILESHLGTKGKAYETNSVWNVGTYDNGRILYRYADPNESIEPYLSLLKERYLVDKDLHSLVEDRGYINDEGKRFATARGYEDAMRKLMVIINAETSITFYQSLLNMDNDILISFFMPNDKEKEPIDEVIFYTQLLSMR